MGAATVRRNGKCVNMQDQQQVMELQEPGNQNEESQRGERVRELSGASERKQSIQETHRIQNKYSTRLGNGCTSWADLDTQSQVASLPQRPQELRRLQTSKTA